jgi:hypothetical protein
VQDKAMTRSQDDGVGPINLTRVDFVIRVHLGGDDWIFFVLAFMVLGLISLYIFIS